MGFTLASDFQLQGDHPSKKRVWGFRGVSVSSVRKLAPQVVEAHQENSPTPTKTVSGIPYWLSRDPIAEDGGINLYGYVENNPINFYDPDGLQSINSPAGAAAMAEIAAFEAGYSSAAAMRAALAAAAAAEAGNSASSDPCPDNNLFNKIGDWVKTGIAAVGGLIAGGTDGDPGSVIKGPRADQQPKPPIVEPAQTGQGGGGSGPEPPPEPKAPKPKGTKGQKGAFGSGQNKSIP